MARHHGNETRELVYRRRLGRQHLLALILSLPVRVNGALERFRTPCRTNASGIELCHVYENERWTMGTPTAGAP